MRVLSLACLLAFSLTPLFAQSITADLVISVVDPAESAIPNATVELTQVATNRRLPGSTDANGTFLFVQLRPGTYKLSVTAPGFQQQEVSGITLVIGQRARIDVRMAVGVVTERVEVLGTAESLLNSESASVGQVLEEKTIVDLPLNGRNFLQLAQISAGAAPIGIGQSPATNWTGRSDSTISIAGSRESETSYLLNGIETRNSRFGSAGVRPSIEAIQEFRVQRSTFSAEFGRSPAIINTTLRSGTNDLRLTLFEFLRNRNFDANNFFNNTAARAKSPYSQNNFGTAVGGPVLIPHLYKGRDRTFWFFNYEGYRQREGVTTTAIYPSQAQMAGRLADDSTGTGLFPRSSPICQGAGGPKCLDVIDPSSGLPFPGNVIPANRIDPMVAKLLPYTPVPNVAVATDTVRFPNFNTFAAPKWMTDFDQYNVRIDHQLSTNNQLNGSFTVADESIVRPALRPKGGEQFPQSDKLITMTWHSVITPRVINEFRFGYNRSKTFRLAETSYGPNLAKDEFGLKNTTTSPIVFGVPAFNMSGFGAIGSLSQAIGATDENFQFTDNLSVIRGKHNFRAGFQISKFLYMQDTNFSGNPVFTYEGIYSRTQGFGIADLLLGTPSRVQGALGDSLQDMRAGYWAGYLQDDWKVTKNLTLNVGIRYEFAPSPREINNRSLIFNPEQGRLILAGKGVRPEIVDPDWNNLAGRVGFAWRPSWSKGLVVRGGAGTYYSVDDWNEEQFKGLGPPFFQGQTLYGDPRTPNLFMRDMLPSFDYAANLGPFTFDRRNRTPYVNQWSFGIQKTLAESTLLEVEYTGSTGQKLRLRRNLNAASLDTTGTIPLLQRLPYPNYSSVYITYNGGWSSYNAMTARLERRFSRGLSVLAAYTWSHIIDIGSAAGEAASISRDFKTYDRGNGAYDVRQRLVGSYVYELPFGRGKKFMGNMHPAADAVLGGWQINGITTFASGQYRSVGLGVDWLLIGAFSTSRPDLVGDPIAGRMLPDRYLNAAAFDYPKDAAGNRTRRQGNLGRAALMMPGLNNWDLGIVKNFRVREHMVTQFRLEMFNAWNHTQFGVPNLTSTSPNFGRIGGTMVNPRRVQLGLKFNY